MNSAKTLGVAEEAETKIIYPELHSSGIFFQKIS